MILDVLKTERGRIVMSIVLGLGLAVMFRRICSKDTCLIIKGPKSIDIKDILMGEVWLASGQSNMEMTFDYCCNTTDSSREEISTANYPHIRMFNVKKNLNNKSNIDLLALDIKYALNHLGEITGEISNEEILGNIFSKFCIGK